MDRIKKWIDDNWRDVWRRWSARFNAVGLALVSWMYFDPSAVLYVLNLLPDELRAHLPQHAVAAFSAVFFVLAMISQFVRQPKIEEKRNGKN